ncbi:MAG TPA: hypothetical protein VGX25_11105 [Actinophytocola sp.]|uniref:hypothetical protein n=1 Tax=Actinophytocola sp. TaxID=1872138 RepID=UPI002DDD6B82|nr:hypothetical protein [Actinophytocola sp.]HEV2779934.1 hypothetical protein [Actinophytocola sp.]
MDGAGWTPEIPRARGYASHVKPIDAPPPIRTLGDTDSLPVMIPARLKPAVRGQREPVAYAWPDTPPTGLRKFDLGTIPASVTPPRTWRRAAWFAVGTSASVVLALGYAAFTLVGNPLRSTTIDALPGQPSQQLLISDLPADALTEEPPTSTSPSGPTTSSTTSNPARPREVADRVQPHPVPGQPARPAQPGPPAPASVRPTTTAPPRSTVDAAPLAQTDPDKLGDRTEAYYAHVLTDPEAAYRLTAGRMRAEGPEGIEARYADVERIEVKKITIDPNWSNTRSVLLVVRKDGSTMTIERELTFTTGNDPKITSDSEA